MTDRTQNDMPMQYRMTPVLSVDAQKRTATLCFSTGARVRRYDWLSGRQYEEELVVSSAAIRMGRLNGGANLLNSHRQWSLEAVLGVVERGWVEGAEAMAEVRFSERPEVDPIFSDVRDGIIRQVSVGYVVHRYEIIKVDGQLDVWRAADWEPYEISLVAVPADAGAQIRSEEGQQVRTYPCEFMADTATIERSEMMTGQARNREEEGAPSPASTAPAVDTDQLRAAAATEERARARTIRDNVRAAGLTTDVADDLVERGVSLDAANAVIFERLSARGAEGGTQRSPSGAIHTTQDEGEVTLRGLEEALEHRLNPAAAANDLSDNGRRYRYVSTVRMAEIALGVRGVRVDGMSRMEIATRALHSTSDFPLILSNVGNKRLRAAYEENQPTYTRWARRATNAPDFKSITAAQLGAMPGLLPVPEGAEFKYGTMGEGAEIYKVATYGRIVAVSRQAIINDDLSAFDRIIPGFGHAARRLENAMVYGELTAGANLSDGHPVFDATNHGNLATGGPSALSETALDTGRTAMRLQKGLAGEVLNLTPAYLIVPAKLEQTAYKLTSANYVPAKQADVSEFRAGGRTAVEPIVEALLDGHSSTAWYLAAATGAVDTIEYCYLDGSEGAFIEGQLGFEVDGIQLKCRLDFAAKTIDYRGLYKAAGA